MDDAWVGLESEAVTGFSVPLASWLNANAALYPVHAHWQAEFFKTVLENFHYAPEGELCVNFHQKGFDTAERCWFFWLNQGHFRDYVLNRIYWHLGPRQGVVSSFPLHVDIETANTCNMNCPMCYRDRLKEVGQMDFDLFCKAIDECQAEGVFSVRLSWRGEPLTHPRIKEMIAYAAKRIKNVSFLTNAFYIEDDIIDCLIKNQVSYVAVSFDGIGEVYEAVRRPAKYEENRNRLKQLRQKRDAAGSVRPQVRVCTVWPAVSMDPEGYAEAMAPVSDYMVYNPYINFKGRMTLKEGFVCQYPWERIMIAFNGNVQPCTGWNAADIVVGNLSEKSIRELWHCEAMQKIRQKHARGKRMELSSCAECRHGSKGDSDVSIETILAREY